MKLLKIDIKGYFVEDVIKDKYPMITEIQIIDGEEVEVQIKDPQYISTPCQGGFYKPKWDGEKWVEGLTTEEVEIIKNTPKEETKEEVIVQGMATMMIENQTMKEQIETMSQMIGELMKGSEI